MSFEMDNAAVNPIAGDPELLGDFSALAARRKGGCQWRIAYW
jgi:hypothetical protein